MTARYLVRGPGPDPVDALQLVVALDKNFGLKVTDAEVARRLLASVATIAEWVTQHRTSCCLPDVIGTSEGRENGPRDSNL